MPAMSDYSESGILSHLFRTDTFTKPLTVGIALTGAPPVYTDTGASSKELANSGSYARQVLAPLDANWAFTTTSASGQVSNSSDITFPVATADWGWVSGVILTNSGVYGAGRSLAYGSLTVPKLVGSGDQLKISTGNLKVYLA
jgi:hypothetical protein